MKQPCIISPPPLRGGEKAVPAKERAMIFRQFIALAAAVIFCAAPARTEVQKFLNPCAGQKLCASYALVLTPPDGWVLDAKATAENKCRSWCRRAKASPVPNL